MYILYDMLFCVKFLNVKNKSLDNFEKLWLEKTNQIYLTKLFVYVPSLNPSFSRSYSGKHSGLRWTVASWFQHSLHGLSAVQARALCGDSHWPSVGAHCCSLLLTVSGSSIVGSGKYLGYGSWSGKQPSILFMELDNPRRLNLLPFLCNSVKKSIRRLFSNIHL